MTADRPLPDVLAGPAFARQAGWLVLCAIAAGLLIAALEFAATRGGTAASWRGELAWLGHLAGHWPLGAMPIGLALAMLEHRTHGRQPSLPGYVLATLAGALAGATILTLHGRFVDPSIARTATGGDLEWPDRFLYTTWMLLIWGGIGAALHASMLRYRRSAEALRRGELARLDSERHLAGMRLAALHGQVEPEFLLATLSSVESLYATDRAAADRVLDALIAFLRRAVPLMRQETSTVGDECRLAQAYVQTVWAASGIRGEVIADIAAAADRLPMPSGILLPIAQHLLDAGGLLATGAPFAIRAQRATTDTEIRLSAWAENRRIDARWRARLQELEHRLGQTWDSGARIEVRDDSVPLTVRVVLPLAARGGEAVASDRAVPEGTRV